MWPQVILIIILYPGIIAIGDSNSEKHICLNRIMEINTFSDRYNNGVEVQVIKQKGNDSCVIHTRDYSNKILDAKKVSCMIIEKYLQQVYEKYSGKNNDVIHTIDYSYPEAEFFNITDIGSPDVFDTKYNGKLKKYIGELLAEEYMPIIFVSCEDNIENAAIFRMLPDDYDLSKAIIVLTKPKKLGGTKLPILNILRSGGWMGMTEENTFLVYNKPYMNNVDMEIAEDKYFVPVKLDNYGNMSMTKYKNILYEFPENIGIRNVRRAVLKKFGDIFKRFNAYELINDLRLKQKEYENKDSIIADKKLAQIEYLIELIGKFMEQ
jgi:hypothetical protein